MKESLHIIKQEHRNLFRVVNMLDQMMRNQKAGEAPDFGFMEDLLGYIDTFTDQYHHPKEDEYLFRLLRQRDAAAAAILDELEAEHVNCPTSLADLKQRLAAYKAAPQDAAMAERFTEAVHAYLRFQTKHLQKEEGVVLPMAQKALTEADWQEIDSAFASNEDPVFGKSAQREARAMYSRIVNEAPAPYGFGD